MGMDMKKTASFWKCHKEALVFLYFPVYMLWFCMLERMSPENIFLVTNPLDGYIPFCEYFIVPYLLWFPYLFGAIIWFYIKERKNGFLPFTLTLVVGLTFCLLVYTFFPNGQTLRPDVYPENVWGTIVKHMQLLDSPENVCPSIHVFSTVAVHIAVLKSETLKTKTWIRRGSFVMACLICLSTVFLKQHSVTDMLAALALNAVLYLIFYKVAIRRQSK